MVYDVILYNGEEEMFDLRYEILKDFVDVFYVLEFNKTFNGKEKKSSSLSYHPKVQPFFLDESIYGEFLGVPIELDPNFKIEFAQREGMRKFMSLYAKDEDIIYVGDVDEIWKPKAIREGVYKLEQFMYYYFLNNRWYKKWAGTFVGHWKDLKNISWNTARQGPGQRMDTPSSFPNLIKDGGWHFTNCMSLDEIKRKIESYSHQEYNTEFFKNDLAKKMQDNRDYYNVNFPIVIDEVNWPEYLKANKEKYKHLCRES